MKKVFISILFFFVLETIHGQTGKFLVYEPEQWDTTIINIRPIPLDTVDISDKVQPLFRLEGHGSYLGKFVNNVLENVLSKAQIDSLYVSSGSKFKRTRSFISFGIDLEGNIKDISLSMKKNDLQVLTEDLLVEFCQKLRLRKFDTKLWNFKAPTGVNPDRVFQRVALPLYNYDLARGENEVN